MPRPLTTARDAYATASATVERMQTERVGDFYTELGTTMDKLKSDVMAVEFDPRNLSAEELRDSFIRVVGCVPIWDYAK